MAAFFVYATPITWHHIASLIRRCDTDQPYLVESGLTTMIRLFVFCGS
jgi:hypothetical protein